MLDRYDQDLLLDYLEDELDADQRAKLDAILAQDPQLAGLLQEMAMDRAALRSLPEAQAPSDLVHDVTQTLERRMLLDEPIDQTGPIPMSRGRGMGSEPARSINWGRVVGLSGLAASVALAAGIVVVMQDGTLERTANELAAAPATQSAEDVEDSAVADTDTPNGNTLEGVVPEGHTNAAGLAGTTNESARITPEDTIDKLLDGAGSDALALGPESPRSNTPGTPELNLPGEPEAEAPLERFAFGSTAAISVIQPRQKLLLLTESPEVSLEQLFDFCVANGIPIVQPEEQALYRRAEGGGNFNSEPSALGAAAEEAADDETQAAYGGYALLINDSQLETLVRDLNNDVAIDPKRAGKGSLISNQAAVLAELPDDVALRYGAVQERKDLGDSRTQSDAADLVTDQQGEITEQQAIPLQLPKDLGSDYANTRNAYNLKQTQQRGSYAQQDDTDTALVERVDRPATAGTDDVVGAVAPEPTPEPTPEATKPAADPRGAKSAPTDAPELEATRDWESDVIADNQEATDADEATSGRRIDPTRGNWLAAHLPVADTTPLLLQWRDDQDASPTSLVPVMIQRAEPDKVNTLRKRQQVELASRLKEAQAQTNAKAKAEDTADQAEVVPATDAAPDADAEPAPPAE